MSQRILVVDDDEPFRRAVKTFLESQGYEVQLGANGFDCLDAIKASLPNLLLLDIGMPEMNGFQALDFIRDLQVKHELPVVMISAASAKETILHAAKLEAWDFLVKPFDLNEMVERIRPLLTHMEFSALHEVLKNLQPAHDLQVAQFPEYKNQGWSSFSSAYTGKPIAIWIAPGVKSSALSELNEKQCDAHVRVFLEHRKKWLRIWPQRHTVRVANTSGRNL